MYIYTVVLFLGNWQEHTTGSWHTDYTWWTIVFVGESSYPGMGLRFTLNSWAVFAVNELIVHAWCFITINHTVWLAESLPLQSAIVYWVQKLPHVLQFLGVAIHTLNKQKWICGCDHTWKYNFHEIFGAHLKFTVSGQFKQASIYTCMENAVRGSPGSPL